MRHTWRSIIGIGLFLFDQGKETLEALKMVLEGWQKHLSPIALLWRHQSQLWSIDVELDEICGKIVIHDTHHRLGLLEKLFVADHVELPSSH